MYVPVQVTPRTFIFYYSTTAVSANAVPRQLMADRVLKKKLAAESIPATLCRPKPDPRTYIHTDGVYLPSAAVHKNTHSISSFCCLVIEGQVQLQARGLRDMLDQHRREERQGLPGEGAGVAPHRQDKGMKTRPTPRGGLGAQWVARNRGYACTCVRKPKACRREKYACVIVDGVVPVKTGGRCAVRHFSCKMRPSTSIIMRSLQRDTYRRDRRARKDPRQATRSLLQTDCCCAVVLLRPTKAYVCRQGAERLDFVGT